MDDRRFQITVVKTKSNAPIAIGTCAGPLSGRVTLGRARTCGLVYPDPSVSREHLEVVPVEGALDVKNLSTKGSTFVGGTRLEPGETQRVAQLPFYMQLGRLLLEVDGFRETEPYSSEMSLPVVSELTSPRLLVLREGPRTEGWLNTVPLQLAPQAGRFLLALARQPTRVVTYGELARAIDPQEHERAGGLNLAQIATYCRRALGAPMDASDALRLKVSEHSTRSSASEATRELLRNVIESVRGTGYRLNLFPEVVVVLSRNAPSPSEST